MHIGRQASILAGSHGLAGELLGMTRGCTRLAPNLPGFAVAAEDAAKRLEVSRSQGEPPDGGRLRLGPAKGDRTPRAEYG